MHLIFIRHGQPEWDRDGMAVDDPKLTSLGHEQAKRLAERLAAVDDIRVDELLVSPLARAHQTAAPISDALGLEPVTLDWLREIAAPPFEGTPTEQVQRIFAEARKRSVDDLWDGLPGGESFSGFHERITGGVRELLAERGAVPVSPAPPLWKLEDREQVVMVVAHAGTNAAAIGFLLGITPVPWEWERFISFHASVSTLLPMAISGANSFSLFKFSDVSHLPDDLQTR
ncbi:MAG: histidine phosphatase family protein [Actinobacteria bacterium]|nr:histidine phosphatase family protein [Actinomycetota bacterium]